MTEATFAIWPTVIAWMKPEEDLYGMVTASVGPEDEALLVFRSPEEADKFREQTGKYSGEEGCKPAGLDLEDIAAILEERGLQYVAMPEPWVGGNGDVDLFAASDFIFMLEEGLQF